MEKIKKLIALRAQIEKQIEDLQAELEDVEFDLRENIINLLAEYDYDLDELEMDYDLEDLINELKELD